MTDSETVRAVNGVIPATGGALVNAPAPTAPVAGADAPAPSVAEKTLAATDDVLTGQVPVPEKVYLDDEPQGSE